MDATKPPLAGRTVSRPHYKALYLTAVSLNDRLRDDLDEIKRNRDTWKEAYEAAHHLYQTTAAALLATSTARYRWASAAVIEALALVIVAIVLLAR